MVQDLDEAWISNRGAQANLSVEARAAAAVLGHNYPGSRWYEDSYRLFERRGIVVADVRSAQPDAAPEALVQEAGAADSPVDGAIAPPETDDLGPELVDNVDN